MNILKFSTTVLLQNWRMVLLVLLLSIPSFAVLYKFLPEKSLIASLFNLAFSLLLIMLPLVFIRPYVYMILMFPLLFLIPLELLHIFEYGGYTTTTAIASVIETNAGEASEFAGNYRHYFILFIPLFLFGMFLILTAKKGHKLPGKVKGLIAVVFVLICAAFSLRTFIDVSGSGKGNVLHDQMELYERMSKNNFPFSYFVKLGEYIQQRRVFNASLLAKKDFKFGARRLKPENKSIYVVIIGETSRAYNWQLNGYIRKTNPRLSELKNIIYFNNTATAATHTRESVQIALTRATSENMIPVYREKSLVAAFKEAGFKTFWISNQNKLSAVDTPLLAIAADADESRFTNVNYEVNSVFDEVLLDYLKEIVEKDSDNLAIFIHTMGSHEKYRERYPAEYEVFKPASRGDDYNFYSENIRERLLNSYDNSILYTDYIISSIIDIIDNQNAIASVVYFSDHGENILDDKRKLFGHGGLNPGGYVIEIPMLFWFSDEYISDAPEKFSIIRDNQNKAVSTNDLFYAMLDIAGIVIDNNVQPISFLNKSYVDSNQAVLTSSGKVIYYSGR